jgi:hypothetical protein
VTRQSFTERLADVLGFIVRGLRLPDFHLERNPRQPP